uniref:Multifunctional fusion protein n=2 Tax=Corallina TaxID=35169 RepID=A0A6M3WAL8_COROI|nr:translation elongation factor Ts [Corallina officinalis]QJF58500.1 translation elongation factor Ts [Corallina officinalis]QJF58699.1 translation elongation factor Ts [Corallina officinalis]QJF58898.1 translation elongation factor Ts [Corallina officinalis]
MMCINISAKYVKELRNQTGAGMMSCKKALQASQGDMKLAIENLRKQGLASANKKSSRIATEGLIESYIHAGSRIGVLLELNCETDFVSRHSEFHLLAKNLAMQIVACPDVQYISVADIPQNIIDEEMRIELSKEDLKNKPDKIKEVIVNGRIEKRLKELSLLDQAFIRDTDLSISSLVDQKIALLGENIKIRRFQKFILGEGILKKKADFSKDVLEVLHN